MVVALEIKRHSVWRAEMRVSFKKVITFNVLFMTISAMIGE